MNKIPSIFASLSLLLACSSGPEETPEERLPLSKADLAGAGSCEDSCGGPSDGICWCDDLCTDFGDCCEDYAPLCTEPCPDIVMPPPSFCPDGTIEPVIDESGCTVGLDCVTCPDIVMPPPSFCPDGTIEPVIDENGCTVGLDCVDDD